MYKGQVIFYRKKIDFDGDVVKGGVVLKQEGFANDVAISDSSALQVKVVLNS
jgi:hypothetical protein